MRVGGYALLRLLTMSHCNGKDDQSAGDASEDVVVDLEGLAGVLDDDSSGASRQTCQ